MQKTGKKTKNQKNLKKLNNKKQQLITYFAVSSLMLTNVLNFQREFLRS